MDKREFKITGTKTKRIEEVELRELDEVKEERDNIREKIRQHKIKIVELETRLEKVQSVIDTVEPPKRGKSML